MILVPGKNESRCRSIYCSHSVGWCPLRCRGYYQNDFHRHSRERAGMGDRGGSAVGARYIVRGRTTRHKLLNIKRAQGCCPWSPSREGARDQSSFMRRGLPSKGEAHALHHQPAPALTLTTPCLLLSHRSHWWRSASTLLKNLS